MEAMGVCTNSAAPLHMTPKTDGTWRPCGDYRCLNNVTEADKYPMPNIQDITNALGKAAVFSKFYLLKGYFQVHVTPSDVPKTAIMTPFGSFVFHYSTFGLKNSGATFQRMMDNILGHRVCKSANYYLHCIRKIRNFISMDVCKLLVQTLVMVRLDYCNALLCGAREDVIRQLERLQRQAARVVCKKYKNDHTSVTELMWGLHWLLIRARIQYKILLLVYKAFTNGSYGRPLVS